MESNAAQGNGSGKRRPVFELIAGHPALDLVNTLDWRFRETPEELLSTYNDLLRFTEQASLISAAQARRLIRNTSESKAAGVLAAVRELREAVAEVLYAALEDAPSSAAAIRILERCFRAAREHQRLLWSESKFIWDLQPSSSESELPLWMLSIESCELMTSDKLQRLRECGNAECRWLFLDTSKNHTRRWCEMKICGNRMKARRFKAQHRT